MSFGMTFRIARKRPRHSFGAGHSKVIEVVRMSSSWKVGVNDVLSKIGAIPSDSIKVIFIRQGVEFGDESEVLLRRGVNYEDAHTAKQGGADHLPPFGLVAVDARWALTIGGQVFDAVAILKNALNFIGAENRAVLWIFRAVEIDIKGNDVPFWRFVFADVDVITDHRARLIRAAHSEL